MLDETVANNDLPGALLAVSLPERQTWIGASGLADQAQGQAMAPDSLFRIGSLSKMFTAVVALQLMDEGTLDLDSPITTWLAQSVPAADKISIRQLLSHTSGIYDYLDNPFIGRVVRDPQRVWQPHELVEYAVDRGAYFEPGTPGRWRYSNTNYVLLSMIIERATDISLAQQIRQRILDPLELQHTFFTPDESVQGPLARGYVGASDWTDLHMSYARGTASIVSTVADLQRFGQALFSGQLLKPPTFESMSSFVNTNNSFGMQELEYGLGLMRNPLAVGPDPSGQPRASELQLALGHIGGVSGYRSALWYLPESKITIVVGFNEASVNPVLLPTRVLDVLLTYQNR